MANIIVSNSRIVFGNSSNVFAFAASGFTPVVLDFEALGGYRSNQNTMFLEFWVNGRLLQTVDVHRWMTHSTIIPDRRMIVVAPSFLFPLFTFPVTNVLIVRSVDPTDYFFIGPVIVHP